MAIAAGRTREYASGDKTIDLARSSLSGGIDFAVMTVLRTVILSALLGLTLAGFALSVLANASDPAANPTERCTLYFSSGVTLADVPVARTPAQMAQGLMFRDDVGRGMLFSWSSAEQRVFWMHNTPTPLSVGFISVDGTLFAIDDMAPNTDDYHYSPMPATDALELARGEFAQKGLMPGSRLLRRECDSDQYHRPS